MCTGTGYCSAQYFKEPCHTRGHTVSKIARRATQQNRAVCVAETGQHTSEIRSWKEGGAALGGRTFRQKQSEGVSISGKRVTCR